MRDGPGDDQEQAPLQSSKAEKNPDPLPVLPEEESLDMDMEMNMNMNMNMEEESTRDRLKSIDDVEFLLDPEEGSVESLHHVDDVEDDEFLKEIDQVINS
jgi:hypothetical protein